VGLTEGLLNVDGSHFHAPNGVRAAFRVTDLCIIGPGRQSVAKRVKNRQSWGMMFLVVIQEIRHANYNERSDL
jgi:hypothetical protein